MKKKKINKILKKQIRFMDERIQNTERCNVFNRGYINGLYIGKYRMIEMYEKINKKDHGC